MGVNHDQFSHFSRLRHGSSVVLLQTLVILAQFVSFGGFWAPYLISAWNDVVSVGQWCV